MRHGAQGEADVRNVHDKVQLHHGERRKVGVATIQRRMAYADSSKFSMLQGRSRRAAMVRWCEAAQGLRPSATFPTLREGSGPAVVGFDHSGLTFQTEVEIPSKEYELSDRGGAFHDGRNALQICPAQPHIVHIQNMHCGMLRRRHGAHMEDPARRHHSRNRGASCAPVSAEPSATGALAQKWVEAHRSAMSAASASVVWTP